MLLVIQKEDYIYKNNNAFCFNVNWKLFTPQLYRIQTLHKQTVCLQTQDYPSISQVGMKAKDKNFNIIFAVTSEQKDIYDQLKPYIAGSETGELASDSHNIVKLIRDSYLVRNIRHCKTCMRQ